MMQFFVFFFSEYVFHFCQTFDSREIFLIFERAPFELANIRVVRANYEIPSMEYGIFLLLLKPESISFVKKVKNDIQI